MTGRLYQIDEKAVKEFNSRYSKGYMTAPRVLERRRISEVISEIGLSSKGTALDFGCGKGDFTILIHQLLPGWRVIGLDISSVAVQKARESFAGLEFYTIEEFLNGPSVKFDFVFSHHVLEYVKDLEYVFEMFRSFSHERTRMLHIVPCGHGAGLEYRIASHVRFGIIPSTGLYFFEHPAHIQRFQEEVFVGWLTSKGYVHQGSWFVDQYWGALEWMTRMQLTNLSKLTPARRAVDQWGVFYLLILRIGLYFCFACRYPYFNLEKAKRKRAWGLLRWLFFILNALTYYPSWVFNKLLLSIVEIEWRLRKKDRSGGKMYLLFSRTPN